MKGGLEVVIHSDGFVFSFARELFREELRGGSPDLVRGLTTFIEKHGLASRTVQIFLAEELIFGLELDLPLRTPDLKEAAELQLGLALPFPQEEALSAYSVTRQAEGYRVLIFAARARTVAVALEELIEEGFTVKGIYPEHQRYLTKQTGGQEWALVMPGRPAGVYVFAEGGQLKNRLIYHLEPPPDSGFLSAAELLAETPLLQEYNLLPPSYRRPDYLKMAIVALVALNLLALVVGIGFRFQRLSGLAEKTETEIAELSPQVKEVNQTRAQVEREEEFLAALTALGGNPDLPAFFQKLTAELPLDSYLDQFRFDSQQQTVTINGYSDDLAAMTKSLQGLGEVRLKSTSRRKNRNYFQVEIGLP
jgi:Tfp pilus assembly protein PilN